MGTYDVQIFQTQTLYDEKGNTPMYRMRDYLQYAFDNYVADHDVSITLDYSHPRMYEDNDESYNYGYKYTQTVLDSGFGDPCGSTYNYDGIGFHFEDWLGCSDSMGDDVYVLLTASHGGAGHTILRSEADGDSDTYAISVVEGGYHMPDAPSSFTRWEPKDDSTAEGVAIDAMQTAFHELGHAFMHDFPEYNIGDHNVGEVSSYSSNYHWTTPMGLDKDGDDNVEDHYNECDGNYYDRPGERRWDLVWADCCQSKFEYPFN
jgi:hypothetical protein